MIHKLKCGVGVAIERFAFRISERHGRNRVARRERVAKVAVMTLAIAKLDTWQILSLLSSTTNSRCP